MAAQRQMALKASRFDTEKFMMKSLPQCGTAASPWRVLEAERQHGIFTPYYHHLPEEHLTLSTEFVKDLNASGLTLEWPGEGDLFTMRGLANCLGYSLNYPRKLVAQSLSPGRTKGPPTHLLGKITSLETSIASLV